MNYNITTENIQHWGPLAIVLLIWELYWKGKGLWAAAKNNQIKWFIAILIINSIGILPILYIYYFQEKRKTL